MEEIKKISESIRKAVPSDSKWVKDVRLNTVLIEIEGDAIETTIHKLKEIFENQLDSSSIKTASEQENRLADSLFGITSGQFLFTSNHKDITFYGAWWPWGSGEKASLRIGLYAISDDIISGDKAMEILTDWFPVS